MEDAKRNKILRRVVIALLLIGILGCLAEVRSAAYKQAQSLPQTLSGEMTTAAITGGRSRGGSFSAPSAPSPPSGFGQSVPRSPPPRPSYDRSYDYAPSYPRGGSVVVPMPVPYPDYAPVPSYYDTDGGAGIGLIFLLLVLGFMVLPIIVNFIKLKAVNSPSAAGSAGELYNDVVTVTEIQIALLAQARTLQSELEELTLRSNPDTSAGLNQMLQETVLMLLRSPEYWTYCKVSSQTFPSRDRASQIFEQLSIQERSKYQTESLVNIGGQIHRQAPKFAQNDDSNAYIVVTLLVGTADDRPLVGEVHSADELQAALRRIGSIPADYLLIYELLWSPQDKADSLTPDGLLEQYSDLILLG